MRLGTIWLLAVVSLAFALCSASKSDMNAVLRQLYNAVGAKDPTLRWGPNTDFCEWDGIKCDTQGLISELSLDYAHKLIDNDELLDVRFDALHTLRVLRLKGFENTITFTGLFNLTELRELNFGKSSFPIDIRTPEWLRLTSLETLDLQGTHTEPQFLGGWIYCHPSLNTIRVKMYDFEDIKLDKRCTNTVLEKASFEYFGSSGRAICDYFSNLRELEIQTTSMLCITPRVEKLSVSLTVSSELPQLPNQIRELRVKCATAKSYLRTLFIPNTLEILESNSWQLPPLTISENSALKEIRLNNIGYKSWADIDYLFDAVKSNLEVIDVSNNRIEGKLPDLTKFSQLKHFNISGNQIADQIPSDLPSKLTMLDLSRNKLYGNIPVTLCQSSALEHLILFSNGLNGSIPSCLGEALPNLRTVIIHTNSLTGSIPQSLFHPKLHMLNLAFNGLSGTLPDNLEAAKELIHVQLTWNGLQGRVPSVLPKQLSILDLSYNEFTGQLIGSTFTNLSLVTMRLNNNQLEGSIPKELFTMPQLKVLELSDNQFSGPIPRTISDNVLLTHLTLSHNKLNGSIPLIRCPCKGLFLNNNEFSGTLITGFSPTFLNAIEVLDIGSNQLEEGFGWDSMLPELRFIRFSYNRIYFFSLKAPKLLEIYASNNILIDFQINTPALQVLDVSNNRLSSAIANSFISLVRLDMSGNRLALPIVIDSTIAPLLRYCNFSHNQLTDVRFATSLVTWPIETIDLSHNKLRIEFPFKLLDRFSETLRHLRNLYLNDNQIYGRVSEMDTILIAQLHVLNLANNQMYGTLDAGLFDIVDKSESKLSVLDLSGNRDIVVEKKDLRQLMSLPALTQLSLSHCSIGGFSEDFAVLNRLEILELADCALSGEIPTEAIRKLRLLRRIDLSSNDFTEMPNPEGWELMIGLEHLDLSGNPNLEGVLPTELSQSGLRYIDVSNTKLSGSLPLIRSNVINVARFANCSFSGFVDQLSIKDQMAEFDISNNRLRTFHSSWNAFNCVNDSINSNDTSRQPFAKKCNMRGNDFQCYAFPRWTIDCCGAVCSHTEELTYAISGSVLGLSLLVVVLTMTLYYGCRYLSKRRNEKSLEHLERSLLADAFDSVEHDMMISWSDINFIAKIGEGAFGIVYKGLYKGTEVAVKALKVAPTASASLTASSSESNATEEYRVTLNELITEVRFLMKLKHPNIVLLMGASIDKGRMAIVLEYMHHGSLHDLLHKSKSKNMDWMTKCRIAHQIACGMQYLHLQTPPVIHRDLKSMNILIDKNMTAKITDFGFSRENGATSMTSMVGTISYMAPEMFGQAQTDDLNSTSTTSTSSTTAVYDTTCDVYSFGIILWELLTEQIPWHNCSQPMLIVSVLNGSRPPIPPLDKCTMAHYTRISTSPPATGYQSAETMDSDSTSLLDYSTTADSTTSTMQSALSDDIKRYIEVMKQCWAQNPRERPSFTTIAKTLEALLVK